MIPLVPITEKDYEVTIDLAYASARNILGRPIYQKALCYLHMEAATRLRQAAALARPLGYRLNIFDAYRPPEAQWVLWNAFPDPSFVADPRRGSPHGRGVAVDLTLIDESGQLLDMGTPFDDFTPRSYHGDLAISIEAQRNRMLLLGIMTAAGWDFYRNEWWHYQLFQSRTYPLIADGAGGEPMMSKETV